MEIVDLSIKLDSIVTDDDLIPLAEQAFELASEAQELYIGDIEAEIHIWVEQGSTSFRTKIVATLSLLYVGIANFDGFINGVGRIYELSQKTINYITEKTVSNSNSQVLKIKGSKGFPEKVNKILREVKSGDITLKEGQAKILVLIEAEESTLEEREFIINSLYAVTIEVQSALEQLQMFPEIDEDVMEVETKRKPSKPLKHKEVPSLHGVEMWFDRKSGKKEIRKYTR